MRMPWPRTPRRSCGFSTCTTPRSHPSPSSSSSKKEPSRSRSSCHVSKPMLDLGLETKGTAAFKFLLLIQVPLPFTDANETKLATNYWNVRMLDVRVLAFPPNATSGCFGTQNNKKFLFSVASSLSLTVLFGLGSAFRQRHQPFLQARRVLPDG